ncbi:MAG: nicotinamide riboside transporter PnuC [Thermoanaerobaculia bacterium]
MSSPIANLLEPAAAAVTLLCVYLAVKQRVETWPIGLVGVSLYAVVFYRAGLYANAGLQLVFAAFSVYGWYQWLRGGPSRTALSVSRTPRRLWLGSLAAAAVLGIAGTLLLARPGKNLLAFFDSALTAFSLAAQYLMTRKYLENWILWVAVDVVYTALFVTQKLYYTAVLYAAFTVLAWRGYREWRDALPPGTPA